jgi:pimeloyl-ACP methyl ester carboxylesterase
VPLPTKAAAPSPSSGIAEGEFERDISTTLRAIYFAASGDAGPRDDPGTPNPFGMVAAGRGLLHALPVPQTLPAWLTPSDLAIPGMDQIIAAMPALVPRLRAAEVIPGAGHWLQQEASEAVNKALVDFLRGL